jgi:hypothetical protein
VAAWLLDERRRQRGDKRNEIARDFVRNLVDSHELDGVQSHSVSPRHILHTAIVFLAAGLAGCGSGEPLRVTAIQLGRSLNADRTVAAFTTRFAPDDTVYVSVVTAGAGSATIGVRWTYVGRVVDEPKQKVSYSDVAATEFHLKTAAALPPGDYSVDVFVDGQQVGTRPFKIVKKE